MSDLFKEVNLKARTKDYTFKAKARTKDSGFVLKDNQGQGQGQHPCWQVSESWNSQTLSAYATVVINQWNFSYW